MIILKKLIKKQKKNQKILYNKMKSRRRTARNRNFSKIWVFYGLLAAILGIVQGFSKPLNETKDEENKRRHTWRIIWGCYLVLLFIILVAQLVVIK